LLCAALLLGVPGALPAHAEQSPAREAPMQVQASADAEILGLTVSSIDGEQIDLARYKGKVIIIVNVASRCGYTPQYEGLEKLYRERKDDGLVILGFPANNFNGQEPGSNEEIAAFCKSRYDVTFPMFAKISVKGPDQHPLYRQLAAQPEPIGGDPKWNFTKFVLDRQGKVVARFDAKRRTELEPELIEKVGQLLEQGR
jgi:glutathione peroxidase